MVTAVQPGSLLESTDKDLVEAACVGSRDAFDALVVRHGRGLTGAIRGLVDHPQDAEDVLQEALIRAWRGVCGFRGDASFGTWLHRVAISAALDFRRRAHGPVHESIDRAVETEETQPLGDAPRFDDPELRWQAKQLRQTLLSQISALEEPERIVLVLRDLEDASTAQTATRLGISENLVRWRLHRARKHLRARLARTLDLGAARPLASH